MKMSRRAKRMDRHHKRNKGRAVLNLVSLMDIVITSYSIHYTKLYEAGLEQTLEETRKLEADLAQTRRETKGRFEGYSQRIQGLEKEIPSLIDRVTKLRNNFV